MRKNYVVDTNVLLDNPESIDILINGEENNVYIPYHVILELDKLKKNDKISHIIPEIINKINSDNKHIHILKNDDIINTDDKILKEVVNNNIENPILVSNDRILRLKAKIKDIDNQEFNQSKPFQSESEKYTGFVEDGENYIHNCFYWKDGKVYFNSPEGQEKLIDYENVIWKIKPRTIYQNLAFELMLNEKIDLVSIQSEAGFGKTLLALASAIYLTFEKKLFDKVYFFKSNVEIGEKLGYLPGDVDEKFAPYIKYVEMLLKKLNTLRPIKMFLENGTIHKDRIEFLPLNYIRGMNIENAVVIIDEFQNISKNESRILLSRMGENVKCFCLGDTNQVDNIYLNESNNGLNWLVKCMKGLPNYAHLVLKGNKSRGPIADMVRNSKL